MPDVWSEGSDEWGGQAEEVEEEGMTPEQEERLEAVWEKAVKERPWAAEIMGPPQWMVLREVERLGGPAPRNDSEAEERMKQVRMALRVRYGLSKDPVPPKRPDPAVLAAWNAEREEGRKVRAREAFAKDEARREV